MEPIEIRRLIREITQKVKKLRLIERATAIAKLGESRMKEGDDYTILTYEYRRDHLIIKKSNYHWGPEYIQVYFENMLVFEADFEEGVKGKLKEIKVKTFSNDSRWIEALDVSKHRKVKKDQEAAKKKAAKEEAARMKGNQPLSEDEAEQARTLFG